jgi:hypothetical protein
MRRIVTANGCIIEVTMMVRPYGTWGTLALVAAALLGTVARVSAQTLPPPVSMTQDLPSADFLFGRPRVSLGLRAGLMVPGEGSDLFDFVQDQLTIQKGDFRGPAFAADLGFALSDRLDIVAGFEFTRKTIASEYRDFVDNNLLPIEQSSELSQNFATASLRFMLIPRGQRAGSFAWIPSRVAPYVGAGGGLLWWRFLQYGDFVDFQDLGVFSDQFGADGTSPTGHVFGGADIRMYKRLFFTAEGSYVWASGTLDGDFVGFAPLDLSGFRASAGINVLF